MWSVSRQEIGHLFGVINDAEDQRAQQNRAKGDGNDKGVLNRSEQRMNPIVCNIYYAIFEETNNNYIQKTITHRLRHT